MGIVIRKWGVFLFREVGFFFSLGFWGVGGGGGVFFFGLSFFLFGVGEGVGGVFFLAE